MDKTDIRTKEMIHLTGVANCYDLLYSNFLFVESEFDSEIPIRLTKNREYLAKKNALGRGAISWFEPVMFPRRIESINFDLNELKGVNLFFSFLHEIGHAKDYNNPRVEIKTNESEISAWKNVLIDLEKFDNLLELEEEFQKALDKYLSSYVNSNYSIDKLRQIKI